MSRFAPAPVRVRAPASSANLGPGFDALGLALDLYDEVVAEVAGTTVRVEVTGEGAGELPGDASHLVARCALATFEVLGAVPPGLRLTCHNRIPQARGLGSSSAAIVAGILAARALVPGAAATLDTAAVLGLAAGIEGHPDNVAACLLGGLTIAWYDGPAGTPVARAVRVAAPAVPVTVLVPPRRALTATARAALPATVPHADAAHAAGRAALLVHALTGAPQLLLPATEDRLHQPYRAAVMPATAALVAALRARGVPAVVSGAGPTVLAFAGTGEIPVTPGWSVSVRGVDPYGARVG